MATEIKMPQLSDTMDSGKILTWNKSVGDTIERGDILAEVETDKANLEIESFFKGVLLDIVVPAEGTAGVGEVIAYIGDAGEKVPSSSSTPAKAETAPAAEATPAVTPESTSSNGAAAAPTSVAPTSDDRIKASPLAKRLAEERNVDLASIQGSGPNGRIIKKDVEAAIGGATPQPAAVAAPTSSSTPAAPVAPAAQSAPTSGGTLTPLSKMRATIARRMQEAVVEAPHFYTTTSIDMTEALALRKAFKEDEALKSISINHLVIKAAAYALTKEPRVNGAVRDGQLYTPNGINVGIVTALPDGLMIPVIKDTDRLPLQDLAFEARAAIDRARAGRPNSSDLSGGTFSISNMGMFDVENFTAIINPGQGAILAVSSVIETPVVKNGSIVVRPMMKVTLSVDHRIIDGVMAGNFLKAFTAGLENPALMLV